MAVKSPGSEYQVDIVFWGVGSDVEDKRKVDQFYCPVRLYLQNRLYLSCR